MTDTDRTMSRALVGSAGALLGVGAGSLLAAGWSVVWAAATETAAPRVGVRIDIAVAVIVPAILILTACIARRGPWSGYLLGLLVASAFISFGYLAGVALMNQLTAMPTTSSFGFAATRTSLQFALVGLPLTAVGAVLGYGLAPPGRTVRHGIHRIAVCVAAVIVVIGSFHVADASASADRPLDTAQPTVRLSRTPAGSIG